MIRTLSHYMKTRREAKKDRLRRKNAALRAQGIEPLKGWGKMVDSGFGGLNVQTSKLANIGFRKHEAEEIGKQNDRINQ